MDTVPQLKFEIVWKDPDMMELAITAIKNDFSGKTKIYVQSERILDLAHKLEGFPLSNEQTISYSLGDKQSESFLGLKFYCINMMMNTAVSIELMDTLMDNNRREVIESIQVELKFETQSLIEFLHQLNSIASKKDGTAILFGIIPQ